MIVDLRVTARDFAAGSPPYNLDPVCSADLPKLC